MHNGEHTKRTRGYLNQALTDDQWISFIILIRGFSMHLRIM